MSQPCIISKLGVFDSCSAEACGWCVHEAMPGGLIDSLCDVSRAVGDNSNSGIILRLGE